MPGLGNEIKNIEQEPFENIRTRTIFPSQSSPFCEGKILFF